MGSITDIATNNHNNHNWLGLISLTPPPPYSHIPPAPHPHANINDNIDDALVLTTRYIIPNPNSCCTNANNPNPNPNNDSSNPNSNPSSNITSPSPTATTQLLTNDIIQHHDAMARDPPISHDVEEADTDMQHNYINRNKNSAADTNNIHNQGCNHPHGISSSSSSGAGAGAGARCVAIHPNPTHFCQMPMPINRSIDRSILLSPFEMCGSSSKPHSLLTNSHAHQSISRSIDQSIDV